MRDVPYLPILYVRQHANVSSTDADFFKSQVGLLIVDSSYFNQVLAINLLTWHQSIPNRRS